MEKLPSRQALAEARNPIRKINDEHKAALSRLDKTALWVTEHIGTPGFFLAIFGWTVLWLGWNLLAPTNLRFDPPTSFAFWLFLSNMIQIFLMPLIMIGQNLQAQHAERRAESDFEVTSLLTPSTNGFNPLVEGVKDHGTVNVKAEREIDAILIHLEWQNQLLETILEKLEKLPEK